MADLTPDTAIDTLRSLVFEHERTLVAWVNNMSEDAAEATTNDAHTALVYLQGYVDAAEMNDGGEETLP